MFAVYTSDINEVCGVSVTMSNLTLMGYWVAMLFKFVLTMGFIVEFHRVDYY